MVFRFFFFHADRVTHVYTLSLHDALPICVRRDRGAAPARGTAGNRPAAQAEEQVCSGADDELADADRRGRAIGAQRPGVPAGVRARVGDRVWRVATAELAVGGAAGSAGCCALTAASSVSTCTGRRLI